MATLYSPYFQAIAGATGVPLSGATLGFYTAGTTTEITIYQDADEQTPHENPVEADAGGIFPPIYVPGGITFKTVLKNAAGVTVQTVDDITPVFSGDYDDLSNKPALGNSASRDVGTGPNTVAAGNDPRITGAAQLGEADQIITGGAGVDPLDLGTVTTGTETINVAACPMQAMVNGGAFALDVSEAYGWCILLVTNNVSAGAIDLDAFDVVDGDSFTTSSGDEFECDIRHTPLAKSIYIKAL